MLSAASGGGRSHGSIARLVVEKAAAQAQYRAQREENARLGARLREENARLGADLAERGLVEALSKASGGNESHGSVARLVAEGKAALVAADRATGPDAKARLTLEAGRNAILQLELGKARQTAAQLGDAVQLMQVAKMRHPLPVPL